MTEHKKITDAGVARLPVHEGRAELLEEIMATTPLESADRATADPGGPSPTRRWLPVVGAAAAVAVVAAGAVWLGNQQGEKPAERGIGVASAPGSGEIAVLPGDDWELTYASVSEDAGGELSYEAVDQSIDASPDDDWGVTLEIHWRPADLYADFYADREDIGPGEEIELLGEHATMWHYAKDDHTAIRDVVGDFTLEVRGGGLLRDDYLALLDQLEAVAPADLDAHLPEEFVTDAERADVVADMLDPLPVPDGFDRSAVESEEISRYQLGADVTSAVTCAWLDQYTTAHASGDRSAEREAADAMATSRTWPILKEMADSGDWSDVIWEMADHMAAGDAPLDWSAGIGCE